MTRDESVSGPVLGLAGSSLTAAAFAAFYGAGGATFPYLPVYYESLGLSLTAIGLVFALSAVAILLAAPLWGVATDQIGAYRLTLVAAAVLGVLAAIGLANARTLPALLVAALALACGQAGVQGLLNARTLQGLGARRTLYGRFRLWGSIGFIGASLAVGALASRAGSTSIFLVYVPTVVVLAVIFALLPELPRRPRYRAPRPSALLRDPVMVGFLIGSTLEWGAVVAVNTYVSIDVVNHGGAAWLVGLAWSLSAVIQIPVMWMYGRWADRIGLAPLIAVGALVYAVRPIAYVLADNALPLVLLTSLEGLGYALFICGGVAFVASRGPRELAATAQGVFTGATIGLGAIFGSLVGGWIAGSYSIEVLFVASSLVGVLGAVIVTRAALTGLTLVPLAGTHARSMKCLSCERSMFSVDQASVSDRCPGAEAPSTRQ